MSKRIIGNRFWQVDLHIHTPASKDFKEPTVTPKDIVKASLDVGLEAIAITDHNNIAWIEAVRDAGSATGLVVFPGFEINASGGHVLAIFSPDEEINVVETALIECGIKMKDFGNLEALGKEIREVFEVISSNGGIAIGAHVDGPQGFMSAIEQGQTKIAVFNNDKLSAIEILDLEDAQSYIQGRNKDYSRKIACIQGSDAHELGHIGNRRTLFRMHHPNLDGLHQALEEPLLRIRFPSEWTPISYPHIRSICVNQGFLAGESINFNTNLNCLIGGAGSGKSTVIEFIRFALDQVSTIKDFEDDCIGKVNELAGLSAIIEVEIALEDGEVLKVTREVDGETNPIRIQRISDNTQLDNVDVGQLFGIHAYSQGEAIEISRSPLHQLELIDKHLEIRDLKADIERTYQELQSQVEGIVRLEAKIKDRESIESDIATTGELIAQFTRQLNNLKTAQESEAVSSHHLWEREKDTLSLLVRSFEDLTNEAGSAFDRLPLPPLSISIPEGESPNKHLIESTFEIAKKLEVARETAKVSFLQQSREVHDEIKKVAGEWKKKYEEHIRVFRSLEFEEGEEKIKTLNSELIKHQRRKQSQQAALRGIEAAEQTHKELYQQRKTLLDELSDRRKRIYEYRRVKAKEFVKKIGPRISLKVINNGNREAYIRSLDGLLKGTRASVEVKGKIVSKLLPIELSKLVREDNYKELAEITGIGDRWAETIVQHKQASPEFPYLLESVVIEDFVEIGFQIEEGNYKPIEKLSTGQKATVIVLLSMVEGDRPIVFDQPEDALYTPFIYSEVVKILKQEKDTRQFIFATHNSNISVASDLDLGIILEGSATKATIEAAGGLDDEKTRDLMVLHLEGGKDAFTTRGKKLRLN